MPARAVEHLAQPGRRRRPPPDIERSMTRVRGRSGGRTVLGMVAALVLAAGAAACSGDDDGDDAAGEAVGDVVGVGDTYRATIRRTSAGIPHITAESSADLAFGQGWASGEDRACDLADQVVKIRGERARWFGVGEDDANLDSDFAWKSIGIFERASQDWDGASDGVVELITAFTAGWNAQLDEVGADGLPGWCAGEEWVRPLEPVEVYAYARSIALQASSGAIADFIAGAQPPGGAATALPSPDEAAAAPIVAAPEDRLQRLGDRRRALRRRRRHARRQPALSVGGGAAILGGAAHRSGRAGRLRGSAVRAARDRHRLHRELRVDPHGLGRKPVHGLQAPARPGLAHHLRLRRRPAEDDVAGRDRGGARRRRPAQRRHPNHVVQPLRADHRLPRLRLDRHRHHHLPRRQPRQRRVRRPVPRHAAGRRPRRVHRRPPRGQRRAALQHHRRVRRRAGLVRRHVRHPQPVRRRDRRLRGVARVRPDRADRGGERRRVARRVGPRLRVGRRGWRPRPRAGARRRPAHGRAGRLRVQCQRLVLAAARHRDAGGRLLAAPWRPAHGPLAAHP